ncbi:MAG: transglutaminase-like domain-containing protein [Nitrospiraceae bacterium]
MPTSERQIRAMIRLLRDDDSRIVQTISDQLIEVGPPAVPLLQEAELEEPALAALLASLVEEIRGGQLERELALLVETLRATEPPGQGNEAPRPERRLERSAFTTELPVIPAPEWTGPSALETGVLLFSRYAFPHLDPDRCIQQLNRMAADVRDYIGSRAGGEETVKILGRYLFNEMGFAGNTRNYYDPDNSYLNMVLERRIGIPISLSTVYLLVGERLSLPVKGIGMPGHFLVKYESDKYTMFIDCFNAGSLLTERNCMRFLSEAGYGFEARYLQPSTTRAILGRTVKNLVGMYGKLDETVKKARFTRFLHILEGDHPESDSA